MRLLLLEGMSISVLHENIMKGQPVAMSWFRRARMNFRTTVLGLPVI